MFCENVIKYTILPFLAFGFIAYYVASICILAQKTNHFNEYYLVFEYNIVVTVVAFVMMVIYWSRFFYYEAIDRKILEQGGRTRPDDSSVGKTCNSKFIPKILIDLALGIWGICILAKIHQSQEAVDYYNNNMLYGLAIFNVIFQMLKAIFYCVLFLGANMCILAFGSMRG